MHEVEEDRNNLLHKYKNEMKLRKKYHNQLVELKGMHGVKPFYN